MALNFAKSASAANTKPATQPQHTHVNSNFLMKGNKAKAAVIEDEAQAEARKAEAGKMFRFWLKEGEEKQITFLDGDLDSDGMLDINFYYEHMIKIAGQWHTFVDTSEVDQTQPCPLTEMGSRPYLAAAMTIIDHTPYQIKSGANAGKTLQHVRKLFIAKRQTIQQLTNLAKKRGGLTGCTFDVTRIGQNSASVGSQFDFQHKFSSREEIAATCGLQPDEVQPANYPEEIVYRSPEELIAMGIGKAPSGVGFNSKTQAALQDEL